MYQCKHIQVVARCVAFRDLRIDCSHKISCKSVDGDVHLECDSARCVDDRAAKQIYDDIDPLIPQNPRKSPDEIPAGKSHHFFQKGFVECKMICALFEISLTVDAVSNPDDTGDGQ